MKALTTIHHNNYNEVNEDRDMDRKILLENYKRLFPKDKLVTQEIENYTVKHKLQRTNDFSA